jgi:hypothetical protein
VQLAPPPVAKTNTNQNQSTFMYVGIGILVLAVIFVLGLYFKNSGNFSNIFHTAKEIDLEDYEAKDVERLLADCPYALEDVGDGLYWYYGDDGNIMIMLSEDGTEVVGITLRAAYENITSYGITVGMQIDAAKDQITSSGYTLIEANESNIMFEPSDSTAFISLEGENGLVSMITITPGEKMLDSEKQRKKTAYIQKVQATDSYQEMLEALYPNGEWSCCYGIGKMEDASYIATVFFKAEEADISWSIVGSSEAVSLYSAIVGGDILGSDTELTDYLNAQILAQTATDDTDGSTEGNLQDILIGIWHNGETMWATNYHTVFYNDNSIEHFGYRNRDTGYYEITGPYTATASFDAYVAWSGDKYQYSGSYYCYYTYDPNSGYLQRRIEYYAGEDNDNDGDGNLIKVDRIIEDSYD